ncbi:hypothetical protein [Fructobacillus fructosus]|uniref:hypothetical protein n=1 Tax=Fructobacillus fructosus TaxID=1631 RepID=UPI001658BB11|nr:hypothetical protein [Fructobacillus fructosus]MBC9119309.1 hypothetical protein [Fructobacillus fructosus]MBD9366864.1 hypothetical protein [Leuconostoc mesenteroides]
MDLSSKAQQIAEMLHTGSGWLVIVIIGLASFMAVYSAFHFLSNNREGSEKGKGVLKNVGTGLAVAILAWAITQGLATWLSGFAN